jgi:hypothetical protein
VSSVAYRPPSFAYHRDPGEPVMQVLWLVVVLAAYVVLMRWVLPRFGVPT